MLALLPFAILGGVFGAAAWKARRSRRARAMLPAASADESSPILEGAARLEIETSYPSFAFFYKAVQPNVRLDGELRAAPWGVSHFDVEPGPHRVMISYPWLISDSGVAVVDVVLQPGETKRIHYSVLGKISVEESVPGARALRE